MPIRIDKCLICFIAAAGLAACAAPKRQLGTTQATVRSAEADGAQNYPNAAYHLELAKRQLGQAKFLINDGGRDDKQNAERLLIRAQLDAELAMQMARTEEARQEAKEAWAETHALQNGGSHAH